MKRTRTKGAVRVIETKLTEEQYARFSQIAYELGISSYMLFRETLVAALMLPSTPQAAKAREHLRSMTEEE